jgi:hypothetical protein
VVGHSGDGYSVLVDTTVNSGGRRSHGGPRGRGRGVREIGEERVGQRQGRRRRRRISKENRWEQAYQRRHLRTVGREKKQEWTREERRKSNRMGLLSSRGGLNELSCADPSHMKWDEIGRLEREGGERRGVGSRKNLVRWYGVNE